VHIRDPDSPEELTVPLPPPAPDQPPCAVVALSDDPLLLEALAGAAGTAVAVSSSPSTDRFVDQLVANGAAIALIDANCVVGSLKNFLSTLREQFPQLLLLLSGPAQLQTLVSSQIADGTLFRFVHKPASSQRLRLFLDAAMRQQASQAAGAGAAAAADSNMAMPIEPRPDRQIHRRSSGSRTGLIVAGVSGILLAAAVAAWLTQQHSSPQPAPATPGTVTELPAAAPDLGASSVPQAMAPAATAPTPPPAATEQTPTQNAAAQAARDAAALEQAQRNAQGARADQLAVYLQLAHKRLASGQLIDPPDDSARTYLDSALALAPDDADVRATSLAFGEALIAQFRRALAAGNATEAQHWLSAGTSFHVGATTLKEMSAQLQQLQSAQQAATPAPRSEPAAAAATAAVAPLAPVAASANPAVGAASGATSAGASSSGAAPPAAPGTRGEISAGPAVAPTAAPVAPPAASAASPAPVAPTTVARAAVATPPLAAPHTAGLPEIAPGVVSEGSLTRVSFVTPIYPAEALDDHTSGWVELEFTVTPEGKVNDITVLSSEPRNVFDRAARSAIARNRYKPVLRDGAPVAQRARIRVRFQP
jgi:protein TonB